LQLIHSITQPTTPETLIETLMTLSILISRFPAHLSGLGATLDPQPLGVIAPLLSHQRPAVRKRAITTLAQFVPLSQPTLFANLLTSDILPSITNSAGSASDQRQTAIQLVAAVARVSPAQLSGSLPQIIPAVLKAAQTDDNEDLRESSLQTLEALVLRAPTEVTAFLPQIIQAGTMYIKYDPVSGYKVCTVDVNTEAVYRITLEMMTTMKMKI
jgi:cullin-associated NEDD8-dissociated protein 1